MGVSFNALLFFGVPVPNERGWDLVEVFENANGPLEVINLSPMTDANYMLFVRDSYHSGDKNSDEVLIKLFDITGKENTWRRLILDACIANGLDFTEPDWYFATTFS